MIAVMRDRNCSFSEREVDDFIREGNVDELVHLITHSEQHRNRASEKILELYQAGDKRVIIEHVVLVGDYAEKYADRVNKIARLDNCQPPH